MVQRRSVGVRQPYTSEHPMEDHDQENGRSCDTPPEPYASTASVPPSFGDGLDNFPEPSAGDSSGDRGASCAGTDSEPIVAPAAYSTLPAALYSIPRWLLWHYRHDPGKPKPAKIPTYLNGHQRNGTLDTPEDTEQLCRFVDAYGALLVSGKHEGLALACGEVAPGVFLQMLDFDGVKDMQGTLDSLRARGFYAEPSPSGKGIRVWGKGRWFKALASNGSGIEAYSEKRFGTLTGWGHGELRDVAEFVEQELAPVHAARAGKTPAASTADDADVVLDPKTVTELRDALNAIKSDDRDVWVKVGMALKSLSNGRGMWLTWSQSSDKFDAQDAARVWQSLDPHTLDHKWVFAEAQRRGWVNPNSNAARGAAMTPEARLEERKKFKAIGQGIPLDPATLVPPEMTLDLMHDALVFISDGRFIAFRDNPTVMRALPDMKALLRPCKTKFTVVTEKGVKEVVKETFESWMDSAKKTAVHTVTFDPSEGDFCVSPNGLQALNLWRPRPHSAPANWQALVQPFLDHVTFLVPVDAERERFLDWLAHIEQRPGELPHHGYLMIAPVEGIGRNTLGDMLAMVWAGHVARSLDISVVLKDQFNDELSRKVLAIVDEVNEGAQQGMWTLAEKLKTFITAPVRNMNPKFGRKYTEVNCARAMFFSNHESALPLRATDRRLNVIRNPDKPKDAGYYVHLRQLIRDPLFIASIREWLRQRDISQFNPGARAAMNEAKQAVIEATRSDAEDRALELVRLHPRDLITGREFGHELYGIEYSAREEGKLKHRAKEAGIVKLKTAEGKAARLRVAGRQETVWILRNPEHWQKASDEAVRHELCRPIQG